MTEPNDTGTDAGPSDATREHSPSTEWLEQIRHDSPTTIIRDEGDRIFQVTVREMGGD